MSQGHAALTESLKLVTHDVSRFRENFAISVGTRKPEKSLTSASLLSSIATIRCD